VDWLDILGLGASAASGGLFGVIGSAFGAWMKLKERKQKAIEQKEERDHELKLIELQMQMKSQDGAWSGLTTSLQAQVELDKHQTNMPWVVAMKSLFRPFLTLSLWLAVMWLTYLVLTGSLQTYSALASSDQTIFTSAEIVSLIKYVVYSTVFSATTATTWWFGERALSLPEMKNR
jgi:hypothetical protein